ncbi:MAG: immunoglobulin domain-containing protein [Opitutales bacterium]
MISDNDQWTKGPKTVLVFMVQTSDAEEWTNPKSHATLESELDSASENYYRASYHQTWFGPKRRSGMDIPKLLVTPVMELPGTTANYRDSFSSLQSACIAAARELGPDWQSGEINDPYNFDRWVVMSNTGLVSSTGLAFVGGRFSWTDGKLSGKVAEHELGHNWGVVHANSWYAPDGVPEDVHPRSDQRQNGEYGDGWDLMGGGGTSQMFNPQFRQDLHFLEEIRNEVVEVTASGRYRIYNYLHDDFRQATSATRALVIPIGTSSWQRVVLGFGHLNGTDGGWSRTDYNRNAVTVHSKLSSGSNRIDTTPNSRSGSDDRDDSSIKIGRTYSEGPEVNGTHEYGGFHVTPVLRGSDEINGKTHEWIEVEIYNQEDIPSNQPPTASFASDVFTGAEPGQPFTLSVDASDPDNDDLAYDWDFGDDTYNIVNTDSPSKTWDEPGIYLVEVTVSDMKGGQTEAAAWVKVGTQEPMQPVTPGGTLAGLSYRYYEGSFSSMPDFVNLMPTAEGTVSNFSIAPRLRDDNIAFTFEGYIEVPTTDIYTFHVASNDGAILTIGGEVVVDNDGEKSISIENSGNIELAAGIHPVRLEYFHRSGNEELSVTWNTLSSAKTAIDDSWLEQADPAAVDAPALALETPEDGASFLVGSDVLLEAAVTAAAGDAIERVQFFADSALVGTALAEPYEFLWENVSVGTRELQVVAWTESGGRFSGDPTTIQVTSPPPTRSIGINLGADDAERSVFFNERSGAVYAEPNWNNVSDYMRENVPLVDNRGFDTPARLLLASGPSFGGTFSTLGDTTSGPGRMMRGGVTLRYDADWNEYTHPTAKVSDVPYNRYDVYVYFDTARDTSDDTKVRRFVLTPEGGAPRPARYGQNADNRDDDTGDFPNYQIWNGFRESIATERDAPIEERLGNYVVFRDVTASGFQVEATYYADGGEIRRFFNAVQIVEAVTQGPGLQMVRPVDGWQVAEGAAGVTYLISLSEAPSEDVTVTLSADSELDVDPASVTFTPSDWDTPREVVLTAAADGVVEGPHSGVITHALSGTGDYAGLDPVEVEVAIEDRDRQNLSVYAEGEANEAGPAAAEFRIFRKDPADLDQALSVSFEMSGSATPGDDYTLSGPGLSFDDASGTGSVDLEEGEMHTTVTLTPVDDAEEEDTEEATLTLAPSGYAVAAPIGATVSILDNDKVTHYLETIANWDADVFDLEHKTVTFTPDGSQNYYTVTIEDAGDYPTDTAGHTVMRDEPLGDSGDNLTDGYWEVDDYPVSFYGNTYNTFYVSTNGGITFGSGATDGNIFATEFFEMRRIASFWWDLDLQVSGEIYLGREETPGEERTVITYDQIPLRYGDSSLFIETQIELWDDGRITFTWLRDQTNDSWRTSRPIIGLSNLTTGLPSGFQDYDFSEAPEAGDVLDTNRAPFFTDVPVEPAPADAEASWTLRAADPDLDALSFAASDLPAWLSLTDHGDGTATLSGTPPAPGTHDFSFTVSDGELEDSQAVTLQVLRADGSFGQPEITSTPSSLVGIAGETYSYTLTANDPDGRPLNLRASSIPGWLTLTDNGDGTAQLSGTVPPVSLSSDFVSLEADNGLGAATQSFTITYERPPEIAFVKPDTDVVRIDSPEHTLHLEAEITEHAGAASLSWSMEAGPGSVTFSDADAVATRADFSESGRYVLRLTADDGQASATRDLQVLVGDQLSDQIGSGLLGHWDMNETEGSVLADGSAAGNDATINDNGSVSLGASGVEGTGLGLSGSQNYAEVSGLAQPDVFTLSTWVYAEATPATGTKTVFSFLSGSNTRARVETESGSSRLFFRSNHSTSGRWRIEWDFPGLEWFHLTVVYDRTSTANAPTAYINGVPVPVTQLDAPSGSSNSSDRFRIGSTDSNWRSWRGTLDEMRLFDRAVAADEIPLLMQAGPVNTAPVITLEDIMTVPQQTVELGAGVADDGLPAEIGFVDTLWTQLSGFEDSSFEAPTVPDSGFTTGIFSGEYVLRLTADDGGATASRTLHIFSDGGDPRPPTILTQPQDTLVPLGDSATFTISVDAEPVPDFQWQFNGTDIPGATEMSLSLDNAGPSDEGDYRVVMTNSEGSATSDAATLSIWYPPAITTQPADQTVDVGDPVSLSVSATGDGDLSYQWFKDDEAIDGETAATFSLSSPGVIDSGSYTVAVSNGGGTTLSDPASVAVNGLEPTVTEWPTVGGLTYPQTLAEVGLTGGEADVSGSFELLDPDTVPDAGLHDATLRFQPDDEVNYVPVDTAVQVSVDPALLTVQADSHIKLLDEPDPVLTWQLVSGALASGDAFAGTLEREPGETVGDYAITQGTLTAGGNYDLTFIPGTLSIVEEEIFTVSYDANGGSGSVPDSSEHAEDSTVDVLFSPEPTQSGFTFAGWKRDPNGPAAEFASGQTTSFTITEDTTLYAHWFSPWELQDDFDGLTEGALPGQNGWTGDSSATVIEDPADAENQVFRFGPNSNDDATKSLSSTIGSTDTATLFYRFYVPAGNSRINQQLRLPSSYIIRLKWDTDPSEPLLWLFDASMGGSSKQQVEQSIDRDTWYKMWVAIESGTSEYRIYMEGGQYTEPTLVTVADMGTDSESHPFDPGTIGEINFTGWSAAPMLYDDFYLLMDEISLDDPRPAPPAPVEPPTITTQPMPLEVTEGDNAAFLVEASGEEPITYQWIKDGSDLDGATDTLLSLNAVSLAEAGLYRVRVSNEGGDVLSDEVTLTVNEPPSLSAYEQWLEDNSMDSATDPDAEDPDTGFTYNELHVMGASVVDGEWQGILRAGDVVASGSGELSVDFEAQPGRRYILQSSSTLDAADWQNVDGAVIEQAGAQQFVLPPLGEKGFYRIRVEVIE